MPHPVTSPTPRSPLGNASNRPKPTTGSPPRGGVAGSGAPATSKSPDGRTGNDDSTREPLSGQKRPRGADASGSAPPLPLPGSSPNVSDAPTAGASAGGAASASNDRDDGGDDDAELGKALAKELDSAVNDDEDPDEPPSKKRAVSKPGAGESPTAVPIVKKPTFRERALATNWKDQQSIKKNWPLYKDRTKYGSLQPLPYMLSLYKEYVCKARAVVQWRRYNTQSAEGSKERVFADGCRE